MVTNQNFKDAQEKSGLSNKEAAELFAVSKRCIEKWRVDNPSAPKAVIMCLEYRIKYGPLIIQK